ncbi:MAG: prepilin-type N-terminal cleavage/methylation domain-containing protein [Planctomycetes bacterium]|nr:prepilin-type N-terminal cleavage/methylation domain-containing protein [Planctomycetota bacterium]
MSSVPSQPRGRGFTLPELAAVLVLVVVVSTVAIRAWFGRSEVTLQNAAELLVQDLRDAQVRASLTRTPHEVHFHADDGGYHVVAAGSTDAPACVRRYPADAVFEDVRIATVRVEHGPRLGFDALGRPSSDAAITLVQAGHARTVLVDARHAIVELEGR